ncbi:MAG: PD-(D/E)XK nuclease family protein, partial [Polyangiales bacterium]
MPNEAVAHTLRRALIEGGHGHALIGTRFATLMTLASEVLADAGEPVNVNAREVAKVAVRDAVDAVTLSRFRRVDLQLSGWAEALARTLDELEHAEVGPAALAASDDAQVRDVGVLLAHVQADDALATRTALLRRAAELSRAHPDEGPLLALLSGFEAPVELRFLRALSDVHWARWLVRPANVGHDAHVRALLGDATRLAPFVARPSAPPESALAQLQIGLFEDTPREAAPLDASVRIVTYAGVHEEIDAAVGWVVEELLEHATPVQEIALLAPRMEAYGPLLRARLAALPWTEAGEPGTPVYAEGGVPLTERADGARVLSVVRALREGLSRDVLAPLLPHLRPTGEGRRVRGTSRAWELINAVAVTGGERANLRAGRCWPEAWHAAMQRLDAPLVARGATDERELKHRRELQADLAGLTTPIDALTDVLRHVVGDEPLGMIWMTLATFIDRHLVLPPGVPPATRLLEVEVAAFDGREEREPVGVEALAWLEQAVRACRIERGRHGEPAIYLGTVDGVRGLSFRAVRVLGLVEGALPGAAREDPVLSDAAREKLSPCLASARARAHRQLAAFDDAIRAASARLVLSAPRTSSEGSRRQPASVLLDVLRALAGGTHARDLEQRLDAAARHGRAEERAIRERLALSASSRLERIARGDRALAHEDTSPATSLGAVRAIAQHHVRGVQDGLIPDLLPDTSLAGLDPSRPISASRLGTLLACPHRHLLENVLGLREVMGPWPSHALAANVFGSWLHDIAERFFRTRGPHLPAGARDPAALRAALAAEVAARFAELAPSYPFANPRIAESQRAAIADQLERLLDLELDASAVRTFVDVERAFGYDAALRLETPEGPLFVRGQIDKLDREGDLLLVRDLKTSGGKPRKLGEPPDPRIDLQLGLYALVAKQSAEAWGTPGRVGVSYLYLRGGEPERAWIGVDYDQLEAAAIGWLATATATLRAGAFVRTPHDEDCRYCPHKPVCGPERARAAEVLRDPRVPRRLALLK